MNDFRSHALNAALWFVCGWSFCQLAETRSLSKVRTEIANVRSVADVQGRLLEDCARRSIAQAFELERCGCFVSTGDRR